MDLLDGKGLGGEVEFIGRKNNIIRKINLSGGQIVTADTGNPAWRNATDYSGWSCCSHRRLEKIHETMNGRNAGGLEKG